ncbi:MAG TPA: hypothetical protein VEV17_11335 [Bryobacteraceae bacterium]|nr:hypothetical protein [Bryobacteraceae bacterium]
MCELDGDAAARARQPVKLSSLKPIALHAKLIPAGRPTQPPDALVLANAANARNQTRKPNLEVAVRSLANERTTAVPVELNFSGQGSDLGVTWLSFTLVIPIDPAQRRANMEKYLERLIASSQGSAPDSQIAALRNGKEALFASLEHIYVENRTGAFDLRCRYTAQPGAPIESRPLRFDVFHAGEFFEQPNFVSSLAAR